MTKLEKHWRNLRQNLLDQEQKIKSSEEKLIEDLPSRAQLHLTILGVLENGLATRCFGTTSPKDKKWDSVEIGIWYENGQNKSGGQKNGGGYRTWTGDLLHAMQALSQLS